MYLRKFRFICLFGCNFFHFSVPEANDTLVAAFGAEQGEIFQHGMLPHHRAGLAAAVRAAQPACFAHCEPPFFCSSFRLRSCSFSWFAVWASRPNPTARTPKFTANMVIKKHRSTGPARPIGIPNRWGGSMR